jgi:hypothetical protein
MGANDFHGSDGGPLPRPRCPHCNGQGGAKCFINRGQDIRTHSLEWRECRTCEGTGRVDRRRAALIEQGKAMRDARVAKQESLLEASRRLGIGPAELSAIELGRQDLHNKPEST